MIISAIANEDVAAGEGALRTCNMCDPTSPTPLSNIKSLTSEPSAANACALTPEGPLQKNNNGCLMAGLD